MGPGSPPLPPRHSAGPGEPTWRSGLAVPGPALRRDTCFYFTQRCRPCISGQSLSQGRRGRVCADPLGRQQVPQARERGCGSRDWPPERGNSCMPSAARLPGCVLCREWSGVRGGAGGCGGPGPRPRSAADPLPSTPIFQFTRYFHSTISVVPAGGPRGWCLPVVLRRSERVRDLPVGPQLFCLQG